MSSQYKDLEFKIKAFDLELEDRDKEFKKKRRLQKAFVADFPPSSIPTLKLDDYVLGKGSKNSFCYRVETGLIELGNMKGATSFKFGIYFGKKGEDVVKKYRFSKKYGNSVQIAFKNVTEEIKRLIIAGKQNDGEIISKSKIAPLFRYKLLGSYFPDKYLNLYSVDHADYFLSELGLFVEQKSLYYKQKVLIEFKNKHHVMKNWGLLEYNTFLYKTIGRPHGTEKQQAELGILPPFEKVKPNEIALEIGTKPDPSGLFKPDSGKKKQDYDKQNERNSQLGKRGELIVFKMEQDFFKAKGFSLHLLEHTSLKNDRLGYDILTLDENQCQKHIEVKATRRSPNEYLNFMITANEIKQARALNNYYIYMVFEAHTTSPKIWKLKEPFKKHSAKILLEPVSYKAYMKTKKKF